MSLPASDEMPLNHAPAKRSELTHQAGGPTETTITKTDESSFALIDADRLEREPIRLLLLTDALFGLADIEAGRTYRADAAIARLQQRRSVFGSRQEGQES